MRHCYLIERKELAGNLSNLYLGFCGIAKLRPSEPFKYAYKFYDKESAEAFLAYLKSIFCCKFNNYEVTCMPKLPKKSSKP